MVDYSDFQECSFRDISFPIVNINENFTQDLALHKKTDRNGARVEGTGLNPFVYTLNIPFINKVGRAKNETWSDLYPSTFLAFREAFKDRSTGILVHPVYGQINVKPQTWNSDLSADARDGQFVQVTFIETDQEIQNPVVNPISSMHSAAVDLDLSLSQLRPPISVFSKSDSEQSFEAFVNSLSAVVDNASLQRDRVLAKIDSMFQKLDKLDSLIDRTMRIVKTNPITRVKTDLGQLNNGKGIILQTATQMAVSLYDYKQSILATNDNVGIYITIVRSTLPKLKIQLQNSVAQLMELNNDIARNIFVPPNTPVKYYLKK